MQTHLLSLIEQYGALMVFAAVIINQLGVPLPAIPVLIVAGTLAAGGKLYAPVLFSLAVAASLVADVIWFLVGQRYGISVLKTLCRIALEPDSCVSQTQSSFERWGVNSLLIAKFIPGLSLIAPPLAGAIRVSLLRFIVLSSLGAALWVAAGLGTGMIFATQVEQLFVYLNGFWHYAAAGVGALFLGYLAYKWWERRRFFAQLRMARIDIHVLERLLETGPAPLILDVRSHMARSLEPRRIPSAIHVPIDELANRVKELPREREVIVYCTCPNEASAALVAKRLMNQGFKKVRPLQGGLDAWIAAGYAVSTAETLTQMA
jgi:membrane protein DedA with SNARE-associated domain/rhodanese-related sulfurtransferase